MSTRVDVLAVQYLKELADDYAALGLHGTAADIEAHAAAVAELIEAGNAVLNWESGDGRAERQRLRAALVAQHAALDEDRMVWEAAVAFASAGNFTPESAIVRARALLEAFKEAAK